MTREPNARVSAFPGAEARAELGDLADDIVRWRLIDAQWSLVAEALQRVITALDDRDRDGLRRAIAAVEVRGPARATKIGQEPVVPPPDRVRDLHHELVHRLPPDPPHTDQSPHPPPSPP